MAENIKDKVVEYVVKEFERYERHWSPVFGEAEKVYKYWEGRPPKRDFDWQNAVHIPVTIESEQTISPRIFTALFPTDAPIDVKVEGETPAEQGVNIKTLIQHYFRVSNVQGAFASLMPQCTLYGTAYAEAGTWFVKRGWQIDQDGERYNTVIESRPHCTPIDFFEIYPHPAKKCIGDGLPIIRKRNVDSEYLKSLAENPFFKFENLQEALDSEHPLANADPNLKKGDQYELLEYWGPYDHSYEKDGKMMVKKALPHWIMVVNQKVRVRFLPNPYNHQKEPYLRIKLYQDAKLGWFGVGVGKIGRSTQERLNKMVNQRLDNVDLVLNRQGIYNANDTLINKKSLRISRPGKFHGCSDTLTSIKWMDIPDVTQSSYKEEEMAKLDHREATGATAPLMPAEKSEQHRTAMGIQMLQGAAGLRFRPVLRMMELDGISECAMFYFSNLKQFMTDSEWVLVTGKNGQTQPVLISPEQIQAKVFFIPTGISETMNKEIQVGQLLRFKEVTMNDPTVNRQEINRRIAELFGFKDLQELLLPQRPLFSNMPIDPGMQQSIQQRLAEGADPEQIKQEMLGQPPQGA